MRFTDKLIEAHLNGPSTSQITFVERDAESFRSFMDQQLASEKDFVAPFDHFFMREHTRRGNVEELYKELFELT